MNSYDSTNNSIVLLLFCISSYKYINIFCCGITYI